MSFGFLSYPMYIMMCVAISISLVYTGIKRRRIDRKALIITYFTVAIGALLAAFYKFIDEVLVQFRQYDDFIFNIMIGLLVLIFLELMYIGITNKGNERSKKLFKIALLLVVFSIIPLIIWIIIDMFLQNRL